MFWLIILSLSILLAIIVYFGALSPFAKLQQAANKHWNEAIALFCELDNWELSCNKDGVTTLKEHRIWRVAGPNQQIMYIRYLGKESDNEAIRDVEKILSSKTALSYMIGKVVPASKSNVLSFIKHGTWAMFEKGDEPEFVIDRLVHLGIIDEDTARAALDYFNRTGHYIVITKTCYGNVSFIMFFFKENELMKIQIRYKYPDFNPFFFREEKNMIGILGVPSRKTECNATWDNISLRWVEDNNLAGSKSGLVLFIDFAKPVR